ncbi:MAG: Rhodoferax phage [Pseudomonadota bacterium]
MAFLMPQGKQQYFSNAGALLVGGKVYTYAAGTTTPLATYSDAAGTTPNTNPVILDSRGEASIFFGGNSYKLVLKDSADATIWTQDNLTADGAALAASGGSALVGFLQAGTGAVATTVQAKLRQFGISPEDKGAAANGTTDDTAAVQLAIASGYCLLTPGKTYLVGALTVPDNAVIWGYGATLKAKASLNSNIITNSGSTGANLFGFTLDGNYTNQTSGSGIVLSTVTNYHFENLTVQNIYGTGILFSAGSKNTVTNSTVKTCGKLAAGYGIYLFASDDNVVTGNKVSDTCIGIVVEASGVLTAKRNTITGNSSTANRADFTQSGAGFHIECSAGNSVDYTEISGNNGSLNGGPGISLTNGIGNNITGNTFANNSFAGVSSAGCVDMSIIGNTCIGNGASAASGYKCGILSDSCTGLITGNRASGSVEGIKTFSTSSLVITSNDCRGNSSAAVNISPTGTDVTSDNKGFDWFMREPNPPVALYDDFLGITLNAGLWTGTKGSDGGCILPAIVAGQLRGITRFTTGAGAAATYAVNGVQIDSALNWQPSLGAMVFEARVSITSVITNMAIFVGVTDQAGGLGIPIQGTGGGDAVTANRTNACGFLYDTTMTTKNWWLVGNSSTGAGTPQNSGVAPVQSTFETFRIEFPASGSSATFFRNGVLVGASMANALFVSAPVTPVVSAFSRSASLRVIDIDYVKTSSNR